MNRREFVAAGSFTLAAFALTRAAEDKKQFVHGKRKVGHGVAPLQSFWRGLLAPSTFNWLPVGAALRGRPFFVTIHVGIELLVAEGSQHLSQLSVAGIKKGAT